MTAEPELLYVNSKITEPSSLSPQLFADWYNDIHIPDVLKTSGIKRAYRYLTLSEDLTKVDRPYLALYPVKFKEYFQSQEFYSIPITSDTLPGPNHEIFSVADFDTRYYSAAPILVGGGQECFKAPYLLTIQIDNAADKEKTTDVAQLVQQELGAYSAMRTYKCYFSRQNRLAPEKNAIGTPPSDLALLWFSTEEEVHSAAKRAQKLGKVAEFKLVKAFADSVQNGGSSRTAL